MKKILAIILMGTLIFAFSSCKSKAKPITIPNMFSVTCTLSCETFESTATLNRLGNSMWDLNFTEPESIKGMTISFENGTSKISYKEMKNEVSGENSPYEKVTNIFDKIISNDEIEYSKTKTNYFAKGTFNEKEFNVMFDKSTKQPISLEYDEIKCSFSDMEQ